MNIKKIGIPAILKDNDILYMNILFRIIDNIDNNSKITISKNINGYTYFIKPNEINKPEIWVEIQALNQQLGINTITNHPVGKCNYISFTIK